MTTTTDTGPDVQVSHATTGEVYPSQVLNEAARLDGAASDGWTPGDPWVPGPNNIPAVTALLKPPTREQLDAEATPEAGAYIPDTNDLRRRIDLTMASYRLVLHNEYKAQLWHEVASQAWAHQGEVSRISDDYTAKRAAVERNYRQLCEQIWGMAYHGVLSMSSQPALPVSPAGEAFLAQGPAPDESMPGRPDRSDVEAMTEQRRRRDAVATKPPRDTSGDVTIADYADAMDAAEPDGWVASTRLRRVLAWIGSRREKWGLR